MARYSYQCGNGLCVTVESKSFPMGSAPSCINCSACGKIATRVYTVPQLNTRPSQFSEANKVGLQQLDATRDKDDAVYNKRWDKRMPSLSE